MGLFDKLLNQGAKVLKQVAAEAIENVTDDVLSTLNGTDNKNTTTGSTTRSVVTSNVPAGYEGLGDADVDKKLRTVLAKEFSQYEVREQVSPATLGGTGKFQSYDFGVYENGAPKLFIMVVYNNTCCHREYRWSKEQAEKAGVPMINFVFAFENKIDYIINRLHQYL